MDNFCYPGKILIGKKCMPIIHHPKGIDYKLFILCQLKVTSTSNDTVKVMNLVGNSLRNYLYKNVSIATDIYLSEFIFLPISPLVKIFRQGYFHFTFQGNLFLGLSYTKQFDRDNVERELLTLPAKLSAKFTAQGDEYIFIDLQGLKFSNINTKFPAQTMLL